MTRAISGSSSTTRMLFMILTVTNPMVRRGFDAAPHPDRRLVSPYHRSSTGPVAPGAVAVSFDSGPRGAASCGGTGGAGGVIEAQYSGAGGVGAGAAGADVANPPYSDPLPDADAAG